MGAFLDRYHQGTFKGILTWEGLDQLWDQVLKYRGGGWYAYTVGEPVPERPAYGGELDTFVREVHVTLRKKHRQAHCGIVYVDDREAPTFVMIFDPHNIGGCGLGEGPSIPGWILSHLPPEELLAASHPVKTSKWEMLTRWLK